MGTLFYEKGKVTAAGTEIGAFVRLDDLELGYAFSHLNDALMYNVAESNSRLVYPCTSYEEVIHHYPVDMHAKGWGAYGTFTVNKDISKYTYASVLQKGEKTEVFVRLSTVAGERGAADTERDIRGCAIKFYTKEGNWDLVGNNTPVFFLRDVHNFVGLNRAVKRDPATGLHDVDFPRARPAFAAISVFRQHPERRP